MAKKLDEIWLEIQGGYEVSNLGRVRNCNGRILRPWDDGKGYLKIEINKKSLRVHRLVAMAFITNPYNKPQVNHINGLKSDNRVCNLEWCTNRENTQHAYDKLLKDKFNNPRVKLSREDVNYILENYVKYSKTNGSTALAKRFNVTSVTILDIVNRKSKYTKEVMTHSS